MKKLLICLLLLLMLSISLIGCKKENEEVNVQKYFESRGYSIVTVTYSVGETKKQVYGYIKQEQINEYLNNTLSGKLQVFHPYEYNKSIIVDVTKISAIDVNQ